MEKLIRYSDWFSIIGIGFLLNLTIIGYPFRIFSVFLHEWSHALMTLLTGGRIIEIVIDPQEGGHCLSSGGILFLILNAGYLGNLLSGGAIMIASGRTRYDRQITLLIGVGTLVVTLLYVANGFGRAFSVGWGVGVLLLAIFGTQMLCDLFLRLVGSFTATYALVDIGSDVLLRSHLRSDARMLAELTHVPTLVWGTLWFAISLWSLWFFIKLATPSSSEPTRSL